MRRRLLSLLLLGACLALPGAAQEPETHEHTAYETDKAAMQGYVISAFYNQVYLKGPLPVFEQAAVVLTIDLLLLADLWRRRSWVR